MFGSRPSRPPMKTTYSSVPFLDTRHTQDDVPLASSSTSPIAATGHGENNAETTTGTKEKADSWWWEFSLMMLCTLLFVGLGVGLFFIDGRPKSTWVIPVVNANAFVLIIMACIDGGVLSVIQSCLGQLKWIKYKQGPQSLSEMQKFDEASRRSFSSNKLILPWIGGLSASIGIAVGLLAYSFGPCVQQALEFPLQRVADGEAFLYQSKSYTEWTGSDPFRAGATLPMKGAVYDSLYSFSANQSIRSPFSSCPSGNCTWSPFTTLGVCSECLNVTENIVTVLCPGKDSSDLCSYRLPLETEDGEGYDLFLIPTTLEQSPAQMNSSTINSTSLAPEGSILRFAMMNASAILSDGRSKEVSAFDCQLKYCLQTVESDVLNGNLNQNFSSVTMQNMTRLPNMTSTDDTLWELSIPNETPFIVSMVASEALTEFLQIFTGELVYDIDGTPQWTSDAIEALWGSGNVSGLMDSVALAMSTRFRAAPSFYGGVLNSTEPVLGTSWALEPHFQVQWVWMSIPLGVLVIAWIFFVIIMIKTRMVGARIWKTNIFPLLFHGLCDQAKTELINCETIDAMEKKAKKLAVQLRRNEDGSPSLLIHDSEHSEWLNTRKRNRLSKASSTGTALTNWN